MRAIHCLQCRKQTTADVAHCTQCGAQHAALGNTARPQAPAGGTPQLRTLTALVSRRGLRWAVGGVLLVGCALFVDLPQVIALLLRVPVPWLLGILALWTADRLLMAWKWSFLLRALRVHVPLPALVRLYYQGTFVGTFLPSSLGGDVLRAYWVSQRTGAASPVYASLLMEKILGLLSAVNWALAGVIVFVWMPPHEAAQSWTAPVFAGAFFFNGIFLLSLSSPWLLLIRRTCAWAARFPLLRFFQRLYKAYAQYRKHRGVLAWSNLLTMLEHGLQVLLVLLMAQSLGIEAEALLFVAVTAVYLLLYRLPLSPDGWGVGEVAAIGLYGMIGVPPESSFALALLSHVLQTIVVLPGLWFYWRAGGAS